MRLQLAVVILAGVITDELHLEVFLGLLIRLRHRVPCINKSREPPMHEGKGSQEGMET